jgi:hypothetical protein
MTSAMALIAEDLLQEHHHAFPETMIRIGVIIHLCILPCLYD